MAGITADANTLVQSARVAAQRYLFTYQEDIPVEQLVQRLCDQKQGYTQFGGACSSVDLVYNDDLLNAQCLFFPGLRPYGVSFIYGGYDPHFGFQLYTSDPSGNYAGWKANCIGANSANAQSILKQDYKDELTLKEATSLAVKVLAKTMDSTTISSDKRGWFWWPLWTR